MASLGSIYVDLLLRSGSFNDNLAKSSRAVKQATNSWSGDLRKGGQAFKSAQNDISSSISAINTQIRTLGITLASAFSVSEVIRYSDTFKQLQGRLAIVDGGLGNVATTTEELFQIAQKTRQPLEGIANFYARLNQFVPEAERAQFDLLGVTQSVATALAITGETSESSTAAMIQFTQAIGTNFESAGQELRSIQEQAPRLAMALQRSFGDGSKSLQQLKDDGLLTRKSVLEALSSMSAEAQRMQREFANIPTTVGQAFTQLDNAFLKYIGQSGAIASGTTSVAAAISTLAENFDRLADVAVIVATIFAVRMVAGMTATYAAMLQTNIAAIAQQAALQKATVAASGNAVMAAAMAKAQQAAAGSMATATIVVGNTGRAVVATTSAMATATATAALLGRTLLAALGGPVGIAIIAAMTAFTLHTNEATEAQERYNNILGDVADLTADYATATDDAKTRIVDSINQRIAAIRTERQELAALVLQYSEKSLLNIFKVGSQELLGKVGIGRAPSEVIASYEAATKAIETAQKNLQRALSAPAIPSGVGSGGKGGKSLDEASREAEKAANQLNSIYDKNRKYITGMDDATLHYIDTQGELNDLYGAGKITLAEYATAMQNLDKEMADATAKTQENAKEVGVWAIDIEEVSRNASRNIHDVFADFLFDPFKDGLGGMLQGFEEMLRRMVAEAAAAQILSGLFGEGGIGSGGGVFGGFGKKLGGLFAGFFANGGMIPSGQFGIVGENGPEVAFGGSGGTSIAPMVGNAGVVVNLINNSAAQVSTNTRQTANGLELDVMIDNTVAGKLSTSGSKSNQAARNLNSRTLIRR